jgi:outer membrane protein OmpA-like peptidoglycan-associated protein
MSRSARAAALLAAILLVPAAVSAPAGAVGPPTQTAPLDLHFDVVPIDLPVSSLDNTVSVHSQGVILQADVLFAFNSAKLTGAAQSRLAQAAANIRQRHPSALRVEGYTDSIGSVSYNLGLSQRRAAAVERALKQTLGVGAPPMQAVGYGEADPVAANTNPEGGDNPRGRALNRRVEIRYMG